MIKDGSRVIGLYGNNAIIGKVLTSRYYGREFLYTVALDTPLSFCYLLSMHNVGVKSLALSVGRLG